MAELMKGNVWSERKDAKDRKGNPIVTFPVIAEIKYDEIRCHIRRFTPFIGAEHTAVEFVSFAGKPLHNLAEYWGEAFLELMEANDIFELDVGVLVNNNFNDSYRWTRSSTGVPQEKYDKATGKTHPALNPDMVQFMFFDVPQDTREFPHRSWLRYCLARDAKEVWGINTAVPESRTCVNESELFRYFTEVRERGFEGLMVKRPEHLYVRGGRTDDWLKMKPEATFDGKIVKINEAVSVTDKCDELGNILVPAGTPLGRAGSVDVVLEDGSTASPAGIEWGLGVEMWEHPERFLGQWVEFKCMERDRQGGYRHPSYVRFREAKA